LTLSQFHWSFFDYFCFVKTRLCYSKINRFEQILIDSDICGSSWENICNNSVKWWYWDFMTDSSIPVTLRTITNRYWKYLKSPDCVSLNWQFELQDFKIDFVWQSFIVIQLRPNSILSLIAQWEIKSSDPEKQLRITHILIMIQMKMFLIHLFIHSFVHSFIYSFIRSFILSFVHSFIRSFVHSFIHLFFTFSKRLCIYQGNKSESVCFDESYWICHEGSV
jgi:hypothetical protein